MITTSIFPIVTFSFFLLFFTKFKDSEFNKINEKTGLVLILPHRAQLFDNSKSNQEFHLSDETVTSYTITVRILTIFLLWFGSQGSLLSPSEPGALLSLSAQLAGYVT